MSENALLSSNKSEIKIENRAQKQDNYLSQSISSPIEQILFLQRTMGNQAVERLIRSGALQAKLRIGAPGDVHEVEADRVVEQVMKMPEPQIVQSNNFHIQRECPKCEENELKLQPIKEEEEEKLQRQPKEEEGDEKLCRQPVEDEKLQAKKGSGLNYEVDQGIKDHIQSMKGGGNPLSEGERAFFEPRFGADFSQVRVHTDSKAAARALNAKAFAFGNHIACYGGGQPATGQQQCFRGRQVGAARSMLEDHSRGPSGTYIIWGPAYTEEDSPNYADISIVAWIPWRFGTLSGAVAGRIRAEARQWSWSWLGPGPTAGCQYAVAISIEDMNRLVALANRDPAARQAETREESAGMPALPPAEPIAESEMVVTASPGGSSGQSATIRDVDVEAEVERILDPTSVYEAGRSGANLPPFPARMDGPEMEVPHGIGTFTMVLEYALVTSDPFIQIALNMNHVSYHWERFDITQMVRRGMGRGMEEEVGRLGQTMGQSSQAASAAGGATQQRAEHAAGQLSEETIRSWEELRDPRRAAEGGSAIDVMTRTWANQLNLTLLPASAIIAAGGQALGALSDLMGAYSQEREVAFPDREGYYMVRCIAQPSPRGPNRSERRAASVRTKIVEVRPPETLARNALGMADAAISELEFQKTMTSDQNEMQRLDARIDAIKEQMGGNIVTYLTHLIEQKKREHDEAPMWQRSRLARELESLRLRLAQAEQHREGTINTHHRPQAAFTSIVTGDTYPLMLELSEVPADTGFSVRLMDLTVPDRSPIDRNGVSLDDAVRNAFNELAFHGDLGRGRLFVRMPASWSGEPRELSLQTGDASTAIVQRRLQDLATALLVLSLVVPGVGEVSAVIGAGLAVERLAARAFAGTFRLDETSISDTMAILGAMAQGAQLVGRLKVVRAGRSFIATMQEGNAGAIEAAAEALDVARRSGRIWDATNTLMNAGGLIWGDLSALNRFAQIQDDEMAGRITHSEARRIRAGLLAAAVRDHGIVLAGMLQPQGRERSAGGEPPGHEGTPPAEATMASRDVETIQEPELERRSQESAPASTHGQPLQAPSEGVRTRFRTSDNLHEIFILNDGRIFRCSLRCAHLRTWYDGYLKSQPEGTRQQAATQLDGMLRGLEARVTAGENTPEIQQAISALDVSLREFIAPDVAAELQGTFDTRAITRPGERLLTTDQVHNLLRVFNLDEIHSLAGPDGFRTSEGIRLLAARPEAFLRTFRAVLDSYPGDAQALQALTANRTGIPETQLLMAYHWAVVLKHKYGGQVSGDIVEQCVNAMTTAHRQASGTDPAADTAPRTEQAPRPRVRVTSSPPNNYRVVPVDNATLPRDTANNLAPLPEGVIYEFPGGHRVWREGEVIRHDSLLAPGTGRRGTEREMFSAGESGRAELAGMERAHTLGQGTGFESPFGILYAPGEVNQIIQNNGLEELFRGFRDSALPGETFHISTMTTPHPASLRLKEIRYRVEISRNGGSREMLFEYVINVGNDVPNPTVTHGLANITENTQIAHYFDLVDVPQRLQTRFAMRSGGGTGVIVHSRNWSLIEDLIDERVATVVLPSDYIKSVDSAGHWTIRRRVANDAEFQRLTVRTRPDGVQVVDVWRPFF